MRTIKLTLAYDGTNYSGWQVQPNGTTIQKLVQDAIRKMTGEENDLTGSGRTDAGVHALAQVAAFRTERDIPPGGFMKGINSALPPDIRVILAEEADVGFHPIRDAKSKKYVYLISEDEFPHPLYLNRAWCIGRRLNVDAVNAAARHLLGEHDFSAFRASDGCEETRVREVYECSCDKGFALQHCHSRETSRHSRESGNPVPCHSSPVSEHWADSSGNLCTLSISANGFLKNMVRNIVGTLVDAGLGKITPAGFREILDSKDRKRAGRCAPACGLYLVSVEY